MRLHPITWLMLFAFGLEVAAVAILLTNYAAHLPNAAAAGVADHSSLYYLRILASVLAFAALPLPILSYAFFVEIGFRAWRKLSSERGRLAGAA